jgi:hypothetical protein
MPCCTSSLSHILSVSTSQSTISNQSRTAFLSLRTSNRVGSTLWKTCTRSAESPVRCFPPHFWLHFGALSLPFCWRLHSIPFPEFVVSLSALVSFVPDCPKIPSLIRVADPISFVACAVILHYLLKNKLIDGNTLTVTGKTLGENLERWVHQHGELSMTSQDVIRPLEKPIKSTGHLR